MIDRLSPRELQSLEQSLAQGDAWPRVILRCFVDGRWLLLGIDRARSESEIAAAARLEPAAVRAAIAAAARFSEAHGLHLLGFPADDAGGEWQHFMAVG